MISDVALVSRDLLDISSIELSIGTKYKLTKYRDLNKAREYLQSHSRDSAVVIGYPLTALTMQEHKNFIASVLEINSEFEHLLKCVVYGPHERMREVLVDEKEIVCIARSAFFRDPIKWISN